MRYCRRSRSVQVHSFTAALTCLRSVETNLTFTCPSPKSFVCNLPDFGRHVTRVFQGLSLSLRRSGRREPSERGWNLSTFFVVGHVLSASVVWMECKPVGFRSQKSVIFLLRHPFHGGTDIKIMWTFFQDQIMCPLNGGVPWNRFVPKDMLYSIYFIIRWTEMSDVFSVDGNVNILKPVM